MDVPIQLLDPAGDAEVGCTDNEGLDFPLTLFDNEDDEVIRSNWETALCISEFSSLAYS